MIGDVIAGRYDLQEVVGTGGMSTVYRARDRLLERTVALKVLHPHYGSDTEHAQRFRHEARAVAQHDAERARESAHAPGGVIRGLHVILHVALESHVIRVTERDTCLREIAVGHCCRRYRCRRYPQRRRRRQQG